MVARKPLDGTVAANVQKYGTGALNIDACRVYTDWNEPDRPESWKRSGHAADEGASKIAAPPGNGIECNPLGRVQTPVDIFLRGKPGNGIDCNPLGRWPSNFVLSHSPGCVRVGRKKVRGVQITAGGLGGYGRDGNMPYQKGTGAQYAEDESIDDWRCVDGCPVKMLGEQSGESVSRDGGTRRTALGCMNDDGWRPKPTRRSSPEDAGTASRFFHQFPADPFVYEAKASRTEREAGCESLPAKDRGEITGRDADAPGCDNPRSGKRASGTTRNTHPTVKPVALMRWCVRLVTPPGGVVLDPYAGAGSTGCGAVPHGFRFIGCELHAEHVAIANARIAWWVEHPGGPTAASKDEAALERAGQLPLLGGAG